MKRTTSSVLLLIGVFAIVLVGIAISLGHDFYNARNMASMGFQIPEFAFLAFAMSLAILMGGIDLSIVATMNLSSILLAFVLTSGTQLLPDGSVVPIAVAVALLSGLVCGIINGKLIARCGVPPMLATIGTMLLYRGIAMALTGGKGVVGFPDSFLNIGNGRVFGFPLPLLVVLIAFSILFFMLQKTVWGRSVYYVGANTIAARFSGIDVANKLEITYALSGLLCGCSAIILSSRVNSARVGYGDTYLLQAILVTLLGGIDPVGGSGSILGVLVGIVLLQSLSSLFTLLSITPYARGLIYGTMLLLVMIINRIYDAQTIKRTKGKTPKRLEKVVAACDLRNAVTAEAEVNDDGP